MNVRTLGPEGVRDYQVAWSENGPSFAAPTGRAERTLIPGLVDIHFHGAYGIDFMSASRVQLTELCDRLQEDGYEGVLLTTVTASPDDVKRALDQIPDHPIVWGFHLEGPFISSKFPGAQPPQFILDPPTGASEWDAILDDPRLKVITMAAELPGATELIDRLTGKGVVVSMGHTNANAEEARNGMYAGARHTTHTYNAMRGLHHRDIGMLGVAMSPNALKCELIYDRLHVSRDAAALLLNAKGIEGVIAVSDSTMATGLQPGSELTMWGLQCKVGVDEVRLLDGTLAGSGITLLTAFRNLVADFGWETAVQACCVNPRRALNRSSVCLWLELDENLNIVERHAVRYNGTAR